MQILPHPQFPIPIVFLFSGGCSLFKWLNNNDSTYGEQWEVPFCVTNSRTASGTEWIKKLGIPVLLVPKKKSETLRAYGDKLSTTIWRELAAKKHDQKQALIILSGFNRWWKGDLVEQYFGPRKLNIHPAYLGELVKGNQIRFVGDMLPDRVQMFLDDGYRRKWVGWGENLMPQIVESCPWNASTVHIVTSDGDHGPCVAFKRKIIEDRHKENPALLQEEQKSECDGPAMMAAIRMILSGLSAEGNTLYTKKVPIPYHGKEIK